MVLELYPEGAPVGFWEALGASSNHTDLFLAVSTTSRINDTCMLTLNIHQQR